MGGGSIDRDSCIQTSTFRKIIPRVGQLAQNGDFYPAALVTVAQAFSPNPSRPPFFCDFPFKLEKGRLVPSEPAYSIWQEKSPIKMVSKNRENLNKLKGYRFDSGYEDEFLFIPPNSKSLSDELTNNGIPHIFEEYNGDHRNRLPGKYGRFVTEVIPYVRKERGNKSPLGSDSIQTYSQKDRRKNKHCK